MDESKLYKKNKAKEALSRLNQMAQPTELKIVDSKLLAYGYEAYLEAGTEKGGFFYDIYSKHLKKMGGENNSEASEKSMEEGSSLQ